MAIYSRLVGGLGNQLFQFANGFAQAQRLGVEHILDIRELTGIKSAHDIYSLDQFSITSKIGDPNLLPPARSENQLRYFLWRGFGKNPMHFREIGLGYNSIVSQHPDNIYYHGYFQSEKYFLNHAIALRKQLKFKYKPSPENQNWLTKIQSTKSVGLHIRRGDFVKIGVDVVCNAQYYSRAIDLMSQKIGTKFDVYVFSNDPEWVKTNVDLGKKTYVVASNGPLEPVEDLRLFSACQHQITANSTFSWWGAWLNSSKEKVVITPTVWYPDNKFPELDIVPSSWLTV